MNLKALGDILHNGWLKKRTLASNISNSKIDSYYKLAMQSGAYGGKIAGAGGGGFLMLVCDPLKKGFIKNKLREMVALDISYEPRGSQKLYSLEC